MSKMVVCRKCHYRDYDEDINTDCCASKKVPVSNVVTGKSYCCDINKDGNCEFFRPNRKPLFRSLIAVGILLLCFILAWPLWGWIKDRQARLTIQARAAIADADRIADELARRTAEAIVKDRIEKAKLPVKIYHGEIDGKKFVIKEFHVYRD